MTFSVIGKNTQTDEDVKLYKSSRLLGTYILGLSGTGKSALLENLISADINQGLGVAVLDPHRDLVDSVLTRIPKDRLQDVILLDIEEYQAPFGINLFTCSDPENPLVVAKASNKVMHIFKKLWGRGGIIVPDAWGVLLEELLSNTTKTFLEASKARSYTMSEIPLLLENQDFRNSVIQHIANRQVLDYWVNRYNTLSERDKREENRSTLTRVRSFLTQQLIENIVGQTHTTIDFESILNDRKILLVKLSKELEAESMLIGSMIIAEILSAAYKRVKLPTDKRKAFHVYADEFQNFATEDFATLITEGRKFGVGCMVANQNLTQLDKQNKAAVLGCGNLVVFRVNGEDAQELAEAFDSTPPPVEPRYQPKMIPRISLKSWQIETMKTGSPYQVVPINVVCQEAEIEIFTKKRKEEERERNRAQQIATENYVWRPKYIGRKLPVWPEKRFTYPDKPQGGLRLEKYFEVLAEYVDQYIDPELSKSFTGRVLMGYYAKYIFLDETLTEPYNNLWLCKDEELTEAFPLFHRFYRDYLTENWDVLERLGGFKIKQNPPKRSVHFFTGEIFIEEQGEVYPRAYEQVVEKLSLTTTIDEVMKEQVQLFENSVLHLRNVLKEWAKRSLENFLVPSPAEYVKAPGIQRTHQDMQNEIASLLTNLPKFTAKIKITEENKPAEYTIKTIDPARYLLGKALQERLLSIREHMLALKISRPRSIVEEEIADRHSQGPPSQPALRPKPKPLQPPSKVAEEKAADSTEEQQVPTTPPKRSRKHLL